MKSKILNIMVSKAADKKTEKTICIKHAERSLLSLSTSVTEASYTIIGSGRKKVININ